MAAIRNTSHCPKHPDELLIPIYPEGGYGCVKCAQETPIRIPQRYTVRFTIPEGTATVEQDA